MGKKHLGMTRPIRKFNEACEEMGEYINAFEMLPPMGEGAKEMAIKEWKQVINNVIIQLNNIKNTQIELIEKEN